MALTPPDRPLGSPARSRHRNSIDRAIDIRKEAAADHLHFGSARIQGTTRIGRASAVALDFTRELKSVSSCATRGRRPPVRLHERSRFVREDGRWVYLDGDLLA